MTTTTRHPDAPPTPPTEYRISASAPSGGVAVARAGTASIELDTTWGHTPSGLPGPAELLATAFAACLLKNLARAGDLLGFHYEQASVDVVARRQDSPPRFVEIHYTLHVHTDEPQRRVDLAHRNLRNYGTVYNTLAAVCDVHGEMLALPAADLASAEPGFAEPRSVAGGYSIDQDMAAVTAENAAGGTGGPR